MAESKEPSESREQGFVWTEPAIKDVETFIEHLADKYLSYKENEAKADQKYFEAMVKHNRNMVTIMTLFLIAIVVGMSYLTLNGRVSGDALLFLVGTITGYVLVFIQRLVLSTKTVPSEDED